MKNMNMNLSDIGGVELNNSEKLQLRGGDEIPCDIKCIVMDEWDQKVSGPDCCPFETVAECEYEANSYYLANNLQYYASCFLVGEQ